MSICVSQLQSVSEDQKFLMKNNKLPLKILPEGFNKGNILHTTHTTLVIRLFWFDSKLTFRLSIRLKKHAKTTDWTGERSIEPGVFYQQRNQLASGSHIETWYLFFSPSDRKFLV